MPPVIWQLWMYFFLSSSSSVRIDTEGAAVRRLCCFAGDKSRTGYIQGSPTSRNTSVKILSHPEVELQRNKTHKMESVNQVSQVIQPKKNEKALKRTWDQEMNNLFMIKELKPDHSTYVPMKEEGPRLYKIWDVNQKAITLKNNRLIATPPSSNEPEQLIRVLPNMNLDPKNQPILMSPNDRQTLSCIKSGRRPQLQLAEENIVKLSKKEEQLLSFSFYSKTDGSVETCSFESAEFPGWFLSTSLEPNKPVGLSQQGGAQNTLFYFERRDAFTIP